MTHQPPLSRASEPTDKAASPDRWVRLRIQIALGLFLVLLAAIGHRAFGLQLVRGEHFRHQAKLFLPGQLCLIHHFFYISNISGIFFLLLQADRKRKSAIQPVPPLQKHRKPTRNHNPIP